MTTAENQAFQNDAFISYSRKDREFAARLEKTLRNYKPPKGLNLPQRNLVVFRDEEDFTGTEYHASLEKHLKNSRKMIVICSPHARKSGFVNDEIRRFAQERGKENIVPVLVSGIPNNEAKQEEEKAFPQALCELMEMPLAASYIGFDPKKDKVNKGIFYGAWYKVLADIYDISRNKIEERDKKRQIQTRNKWIAGAGIIIVILAVALIFALISRQHEKEARAGEASERAEAEKQRDAAIKAQKGEEEQRKNAEASAVEARKQRDVAENRRKEAVSRQLQVQARAMLEEDYPTALLLSNEAIRIRSTLETRTHLLEVLDANRRLTKMLYGYEKKVTGLTVGITSGDLVSVDEDGTIIVQDLQKGTTKLMLKTGSKANDLAHHPQGQIVALAVGQTVELWNLATRLRIGHPLTGHQNSVTCVAFSPDGKILASGSWDNTAILWNVATLTAMGPPLKGHKDRQDPLSMAIGVHAIAFSPDGSILATTGGDNTAILWDVANYKPIQEPLKGHYTRADQLFPGVRSVAFSPDGKLLATGGNDQVIQLWDLSTGRPIGEPLKGHTLGIASLAFDPSGNVLFSGGEDRTVRVWDVRQRSAIGAPLRGHRDSVARIAITPTGRRLFSGGRDGRVLEWNPFEKHHRIAQALWHPYPDAQPSRPSGSNRRHFPDILRAVVFGKSGKLLAAGADDGAVVLWDLMTSVEVGRFHAQPAGVFALAFSPDETLLACGGRHDQVLVLDVSSKSYLLLPGHGQAVGALDFSPDGNLLAAGSADGVIRVWNVQQAKPMGSPLIGHETGVNFLKFSRDGKQLLSTALDGSKVLWDTSKRSILRSTSGSTRTPRSSSTATNDLKVLASTQGQSILLFDVPRWRSLQARWTDAVGSTNTDRLELSLNGTTLAVGDQSKISFWDVINGTQLLPSLTARGSLDAIAFSPDGRTLASVGASPYVYLWDLDQQSWIDRACHIANRNLSCEEWRQYLGNEPYGPTCPDLPYPKDCGKKVQAK